MEDKKTRNMETRGQKVKYLLWEHWKKSLCTKWYCNKVKQYQSFKNVNTLCCFKRLRIQLHIQDIFLKILTNPSESEDSAVGLYNTPNNVCLKVIHLRPHVFLRVRVFPTWSISCEMSRQTQCRRWPGPLQDVSPRQQMFVKRKQTRRKNRRRRKGRGAKWDLCRCWWLTYSCCLLLYFLFPLLKLSHLSFSLFLLSWLSFCISSTPLCSQTTSCELILSACAERLWLRPWTERQKVADSLRRHYLITFLQQWTRDSDCLNALQVRWKFVWNI